MVRPYNPGTVSPGSFLETGNIKILFNIYIRKIMPPVGFGKSEAFGKEGDARALAAHIFSAVHGPPQSKDNRKARHFGEAPYEEPFVRVKTVRTKFRNIHILPVLLEYFNILFEGFSG
jgi:hypothetical protein